MTHHQVLRTYPKTRLINYKAVMELYPGQHAERSEKPGVWGRIPQEVR
jgi:hypothetical protein